MNSHSGHCPPDSSRGSGKVCGSPIKDYARTIKPTSSFSSVRSYCPPKWILFIRREGIILASSLDVLQTLPLGWEEVHPTMSFVNSSFVLLVIIFRFFFVIVLFLLNRPHWVVETLRGFDAESPERDVQSNILPKSREEDLAR